MTFREFRDVERSRFTREISSGFEPRVLENDRLQFRGAFDNWIEILRAAFLGNPQFHADHWAVANATIDFIQTFPNVFGVQINKPERAMMPMAQRLDHFIILFSEIFRRGILRPVHSHENAESVDADARGVFDELRHAFVRRATGNAGEVRM